MKRNIVKIALTTILMIVVLMTFAQDQTGESTGDLPKFSQAKIDSSANFLNFKKWAELDVAKNSKNIAELKNRKAKGTRSMKTGYREQVLKLEESNYHMGIKIGSCDMIQTKNWTSFKRDFNREMTELKASIHDVAEGKLIP